MNKKLKATIALLVIISLIMPFIPFKAIAFNAEDRPYYAEIRLGGVTGIDNDNHQIECGNGENHYATVTVGDDNAILEESDGSYFLYTQEENVEFTFAVEQGYTAYTRVDGAQQPSEVNENSYNMGQLEMGHNYNLDFEFYEDNSNPGDNPGGNQGNNESFIEVSFDTGDINGNVATFNVDDEVITVTINGAEMDGGSVSVDRNNMSAVTFTLSDNFNSETMQAIIRGVNNYNATIEPDEFGVATLDGLNIPDGGVILCVEHKGNGGGPESPIPAPELEAGYLVASMVGEDGTDGGVVYYFANSQGKYLEADGTVLDEQQQPAGTIMLGDEIQKVAIPENTATVRIGLYTGNNTDAYMTTLYHNDDTENVNKDNVKYGTIAVDYTVGDSIGFGVGFYGMPAVDSFVPEEEGTYMVPHFPEGTETVTFLYVDENGENQIAGFEDSEQDIKLNRDEVTLQIPAGKIDSVHVEIYDNNMQHVDTQLYSLFGCEEGDEDDPFFIWIQQIENGEKATLDLSGIDGNYTYVFNVNILNPNEEFMAHVLSWTNVIRPNDDTDLLIDGGFARLVKALDKEGNEIWNINTEYDDSNYMIDDQGNKTGKFVYGDELGFTWERGPMYAFAIDQNDDGGEVEAVEGVQLIFEFVPVYGKQLVHVSLGEVEGDAQGEAKYYKVTMPARHTHFNAQFEEVNDEKLIGENSKVTNMEYTLDDEALDSGTAVLSIDTVTNLTNEQKQGFADTVGSDYEVSTYLDVDLTQVWFKGKNASFNANSGYSEDDVWSNEIYDLGDKKATITITLDEGITPDDIVILHEIHDDDGNVTGYEKVIIISKEQDVNGIWTVTFETSKFSNYAIAEKKEGTPDSYTVTFNTDGATEIAPQEVASGETATKPEDPTDEDYIFGGWYADETLEVEFDFDTAITQDTTVYAKWNEKISEVNVTLLAPKTGDTIEVYEEDGWYRQNIEPIVETERFADYDVTGAAWIYGTYNQIGDNFEDMFEGTIEEDTYYYVEIFVDTHEGYGFDSNLTIKVNGENPEEVFAIYNGTSTKFIAKVKSVDPAETYTLTIQNDHGDNFVMENIEYGTQVRQLPVYDYFRTTQETGADGYGLINIARKPITEYSTTEEIMEDSLSYSSNSIYDDYITQDTTYYTIWFEYIDEIEMTITAPTCGTSTTTDKDEEDYWDITSQTNKPQISSPSGVHYKLGGKLFTYDDTEYPAGAWTEFIEDEDNEGAGESGPFIGTFEGGEKYKLISYVSADFGYMFYPTYSDTDTDVQAGETIITIHGGEEQDHFIPNYIYMMYGMTDSSICESIIEVEAKHNLTKTDTVEATCEDDGNIEYYTCSECGKKFSDEEGKTEVTDVTIPAGHDWNDWVVTKEATVDEAGSKTRTCKRDSSHTETEEIARLPYEIVEGENQTIEAEEGEDLTVKANGSVDKFVKLLVDGEEVDPENYTIVSGSTIATLASSFLDTLSSGNHTLTFVYTDGQAQTNFRIARANDSTSENTTDTSTEETTSTTGKSSEEASATTKTSNPKTGDRIYTYVTMFTVATIGLLLTKKNKKVTRNKRKH